jgi:predicted enzyme related to lactoylglutathione lyase
VYTSKQSPDHGACRRCTAIEWRPDLLRDERLRDGQLTKSPTQPHDDRISLMITSIHTLIYSDDAPATRAFLRDVLGWPYVEDAMGGGQGWLIFKTGQSEMGVHPTHSVYDGKTYESPRHHLISLMCDNISQTIVDLKGKGAEFHGEVQDHGWGLVVMMAVPGADDIMLYEPKHPLAYSL